MPALLTAALRAGLAGVLTLTLLASGAATAQADAQSAADAPPKLLKYAFAIAETGFDPAQISDLYSRTITGHIFDGLYKYDYLARPYKVKPNTAAAMPEVSADFRSWTVRIRPGIYFADDPAFKGARRELVAEDYVYSLKRFFDPATKSPAYNYYADAGIVGLDELRQAALKAKKPFDYAAPVEGLRALDRYTLQFRLKAPRPRFILHLTAGDQFGAVAREVVEHYGDKIMEHPVGTGPFVLKSWRRSSRIVLERNPGFREQFYDGEPSDGDARDHALAEQFRGRRLPMVDRVEIAIIEESQPRWLAFMNGELDYITAPLEFANIAVPRGHLAPNLARRGVQLERVVGADRSVYYFNMEDPVLGGYTPDKVALRRAIGLATDTAREISLVRRGQAIIAQSVVAPHTWGYDPQYKSENGDFDLPRAKALLDMYGYKDVDGDGWRELPSGAPLELDYASQPDALSRSFDELWKKNMDALGLRLRVRAGKWPEQLKAARAGQLQIWHLAYSANTPDVQPGLELLYGPAAGGQNLARFRHGRFDEIYRLLAELPDGPERLALLREAQRITTAFMPHKYQVHRIVNELMQPWLLGYKRPPFGSVFWQYVDIAPRPGAATP